MRCIVEINWGDPEETEEMYQYSLEPGRWHWAWERRGRCELHDLGLTEVALRYQVRTAVGPMHSQRGRGIDEE